MKKILLLLFVLLLFTSTTCSNRKIHFKKVFNQSINGKLDVPLDNDKSFIVDIVSDTFAIDVEFAPRWAMSIGHSLYGATKLNKKPAILLITYKDYNQKYVDILMPIANKYNITVWTITYYGSTWKKIN